MDFFQAWLAEGNPTSYWLPGMFFPQGFMTGVLQTHARQYKIAIDRLGYAFDILAEETAAEITEKPEDGVYVYGLYISGARWDREGVCLADSLPGKMTDRMPVICFKPQEDYKADPDEYQAPLYKTSVRAGVLSTTGQSTNFVVHVSMPTPTVAPHIWTLRATALLTMLDD